MYTTDQIIKAVEIDEGDAQSLMDKYKRPSSNRYSGVSYPLVDGWSELEYSEFMVIDGEPVDYEVVDTTGGMDAGSNASVTFKIGDQYFRKEGYYASHYGYDWDGPFMEVKPVPVKAVEYVPIED